MSPWNETHYARAEAFIGLLADAVAAATPSPPPVAPPPSSAAPAPSLTAPPATPAAPLTGGATAANVFKKIPWKK